MAYELGLDLISTPSAVLTAARRGQEIVRDTYAGAKCSRVLEDAGANWRIRIVRISDGAFTTELIPKD